MPITISWGDETKKTIRWHLSGEWTWDEFDAAAVEAEALYDSVDHRIHLIATFDKNHTLPKNTISVGRRHLLTAPGFTHPNAGMIVMVNPNSYVRTITKILANVYPQMAQVKAVSTVAEAYVLLEKQPT